jgi:uncharacterized cupredoxin-like copper-binding protein
VRRRWSLLIAPIVGAVLLVGCGGDDDDDDAGNGASDSTAAAAVDADVTVHAADIGFPEKEFTATAGSVTIAYVNDPGLTMHTLLIDGIEKAEFFLEVNGAGDQDSGTVELAAQEYTIYCDVPGHRAAGMEGTLTVT